MEYFVDFIFFRLVPGRPLVVKKAKLGASDLRFLVPGQHIPIWVLTEPRFQEVSNIAQIIVRYRTKMAGSN